MTVPPIIKNTRNEIKQECIISCEPYSPDLFKGMIVDYGEPVFIAPVIFFLFVFSHFYRYDQPAKIIILP